MADATSTPKTDAWRPGLSVVMFLVALGVGFFATRAIRSPSAGRDVVEEMMGPRVEVPLRGDEPQWGPDDALVTVVSFSDYECPYCARAEAALQGWLASDGEEVRVVYKHMPMPRHEAAIPAARMAWAAHQQGRFADLHPLLFDAQGDLSGIPDATKKLGLDVERFAKDAASPASAQAVDDDFLAGSRLGVKGTPTFFINGHRYVGARSRREWATVLNAEREAAQALLDEGVPRASIYETLRARSSSSPASPAP